MQATVHLIQAEGHYPHFCPESSHNTSPQQAPSAQDWCQAVRKDPQGPFKGSFAQNDPIAWHGLESTLYHALFTWINRTLMRPNNVKGEIQPCISLAVMKSTFMCPHLWNSNLQTSESTNSEGSTQINMIIERYCEVSRYIIIRKVGDLLWRQSCWKLQES